MVGPDLEKITLKLNLGIFNMEGTWKPSDQEKKAAWELYVELITRISVAELKSGEGLQREALSSLYSFFQTTREILRKYGPEVVKNSSQEGISMGLVAVAILNIVIRPVLAKWHPILLDYEAHKPQGASPQEYEQRWDKNDELRRVLNTTRLTLIDYAAVLAKVAGVPLLIFNEKRQTITSNPLQSGAGFSIDIHA